MNCPNCGYCSQCGRTGEVKPWRVRINDLQGITPPTAVTTTVTNGTTGTMASGTIGYFDSGQKEIRHV